MVFSGPWFLGEIANGVEFGLAPLPTVAEAGGKPLRPWITVEGVYIAAPSKNKDAAYEFVKYVTDTPAAKVLALEGRQSPANKAVYSDAQVAADDPQGVPRSVDVAVPCTHAGDDDVVAPHHAMNTIVKKRRPKAALDQAKKKCSTAYRSAEIRPMPPQTTSRYRRIAPPRPQRRPF